MASHLHKESKENLNLVRPSINEDVGYVSAHLRREDVEEVEAAGYTPLDALVHGYECSDQCLTIIDPKTGDPGGMLGVVPAKDRLLGRIWMLGTKTIERNTTTFLRQSKPMLEHLYGEHEALFNYTFEKNHLHHRWLRWLGFHFINRVELTPGNHFYEFIRLRG